MSKNSHWRFPDVQKASIDTTGIGDSPEQARMGKLPAGWNPIPWKIWVKWKLYFSIFYSKQQLKKKYYQYINTFKYKHHLKL